mmetsp:Transcript_132980/g.234345  ORF Transcript_132980/g.234345 Transcript_132980/m.234345 type:complete len:86 (+) Transcript_132980:4-261(+)
MVCSDSLNSMHTYSRYGLSSPGYTVFIFVFSAPKIAHTNAVREDHAYSSFSRSMPAMQLGWLEKENPTICTVRMQFVGSCMFLYS